MNTKESQFYGVSWRGWLAGLMTVTVCVMAPMSIKVEEPLYSGFLLGLGFYFGQKAANREVSL